MQLHHTTETPAEGAASGMPVPSPARRFGLPLWVTLVLSNRKALIGVAMLLFFILVAVVGPLLVHGDPLAPDYTSPPMSLPSAAHPFGTDQQAHDILRQMVDGTAPTLIIGFSVAVLATALSVVGVIGGYAGGWLDETITLITNIFLVVPAFPVVIVLASWIQVKNDVPMILVISFTSWAFGARVLRSQTLSLRQRDYVQAAIVVGESPWRVIMAEILPNMISLIVSGFIGLVVAGIGSAAGLFFLGLGNISGEVNWFTILYWAQNASALQQGAWWTFVLPGMAIALLAMACALVNYGIDEVSNPLLRRVARPRRGRTAVKRLAAR